MLNSEMTRKVEAFVSQKPRSIHEISEHIGKNWRTADRYVQEIEKEFGTISTRVFRGGTRGALKVVYWASIEEINSTIFQKKLEEKILRLKNKEDFSAFDIFQHINDKNKKATIESAKNEESTDLKEFTDLIKNVKNNILIFSGNLSFINLKDQDQNIFDEFEKLLERNVKIRIICRVDIVGKENIEKLLSLNFKHGKDLIEIHHSEQPLRGLVFDDKFFRIKEIKEPTGKIKELDKKIFIFYTIKDKEWTKWISRIFWKIFNESVDAKKRLEEINKIF